MTRYLDLKTRLWQRGRLSQWFEPRDCWFGWYIADDAVYVCLPPFLCLPFRWDRSAAAARRQLAAITEAARMPPEYAGHLRATITGPRGPGPG